MSKKPVPASDLYQQLLSFQFSSADDALSFEQRLVEENEWSSEFTERVILEYKRFLFLIAHSSEMLTPSWEVDQAWHLHLLYTDSYWNQLCQQVLESKGANQRGQTRLILPL